MYASDAQRKFFHTDTAKQKGISQSTVEEFDSASKGMTLPEHAKRHAAKKMAHSLHEKLIRGID